VRRADGESFRSSPQLTLMLGRQRIIMKLITTALLVIALCICVSSCAKTKSEEERIIEVALTDLFGDMENIDSVFVYFNTMTKLENIEVEGVNVVVVSQADAQLDNSDPNGNWIRVTGFEVYSESANLKFNFNRSDYHKWMNVSYRLEKTKEKWKITGSGQDM
jgi:outer membrane lipoprotein-sorting protein